jgi:hypothetical protein
VHLPAQDFRDAADPTGDDDGGATGGLRRLTWDQGTRWPDLEITAAIGTKVVFCDAASPMEE